MTVAYQLEEAGTSLSRTTIDRRPLGPRDVRLDLKFRHLSLRSRCGQ